MDGIGRALESLIGWIFMDQTRKHVGQFYTGSAY